MNITDSTDCNLGGFQNIQREIAKLIFAPVVWQQLEIFFFYRERKLT